MILMAFTAYRSIKEKSECLDLHPDQYIISFQTAQRKHGKAMLEEAEGI